MAIESNPRNSFTPLINFAERWVCVFICKAQIREGTFPWCKRDLYLCLFLGLLLPYSGSSKRVTNISFVENILGIQPNSGNTEFSLCLGIGAFRGNWHGSATPFRPQLEKREAGRGGKGKREKYEVLGALVLFTLTTASSLPSELS